MHTLLTIKGVLKEFLLETFLAENDLLPLDEEK
jgi:hypothetical protein